MSAKKIFFTLLMIFSSFFLTSCSTSEEKGDRAYKAGNYKEAVKYYREAKEEGNADAIAKLARMYEKGEGVEKSNKKARELLKEAVKLKDN